MSEYLYDRESRCLNSLERETIEKRLKPCPFCANAGVIVWQENPKNKTEPIWFVRCESNACIAHAGTRRVYLNELIKAVQQWQTRNERN